MNERTNERSRQGSYAFCRRLLEILRRLSEAHTDIPNHFPKISQDVRRLPNVAEYFRAIFIDVTDHIEIILVHSTTKRAKLGSTYDAADIFACGDIMFLREIVVIH